MIVPTAMRSLIHSEHLLGTPTQRTELVGKVALRDIHGNKLPNEGGWIVESCTYREKAEPATSYAQGGYPTEDEPVHVTGTLRSDLVIRSGNDAGEPVGRNASMYGGQAKAGSPGFWETLALQREEEFKAKHLNREIRPMVMPTHPVPAELEGWQFVGHKATQEGGRGWDFYLDPTQQMVRCVGFTGYITRAALLDADDSNLSSARRRGIACAKEWLAAQP